LPLALAGYGGWTDRDTAEAFAEYTSVVVRRLGDRIDALSTFNEPWCSTYLSHWIGIHAPGERSIEAALAAVHVTNLAHGLGVQAARAERSDLPMGIVLLGDSLRIQNGDLDIINQPLDWWGFNYYFPAVVKHDPDSKADLTGVGAMGEFDASPDAASRFLRLKSLPATTSNERTDMGWEIRADGISHLLRQVYDRYDNLPPVYITENGACYNMGPDKNGSVNDQPRLDYIADHLNELAGSLEDGIPLKGYFAWSLMDNFEWAEGYKMRFGIVHVDYETQERTIKASGHWYSDIARSRGGSNAEASE